MIWVFGDSFSANFDDYVKGNFKAIDNYLDYKGYVPKTYSQLLADELNEDIINLSRIGSDNSLILLKIMENYSKIKENDIVLINWTSIERFKIVFENNWTPNLTFNTKILSRNVYDEISLLRQHVLYIKEQLTFIKFVEEIFKTQKVFQWTWSTIVMMDKFIDYTILKETNDKIDDIHYGEYGHKFLYNYVSNELKINRTSKLDFEQWEWMVIQHDFKSKTEKSFNQNIPNPNIPKKII
jgi:hypothetical protein